MFIASQDFITKQSGFSRTFHAKLVVGSTEITEGILSLKCEGCVNEEDTLTLGSTVSNRVEVSIMNLSIPIEGNEFTAYVGLDINGTVEYIPLGIFTAQKPEKDDSLYSFTAFDRMMKTEKAYFSSLSDNTTTVAVLREICSKLGFTLATTLKAISIKKIEGLTYREAISYIAQLHGGYATFNRQGQLEIRYFKDVSYTVKVDRYFDDLVVQENNFIVNAISCATNEENTLTAGTGVASIAISNPYMTQSTLDSIYNTLKGFTYRPASFSMLGDILLDPGDIITMQAKDGNVYKIPIMSITQEFDGGLTTTIEAVGKTEEELDLDYKGPSTKTMERYVIELALINKVVANKVDAEYVEAEFIKVNNTISAVTGEFQTIKGDFAEFEKATITKLEAISGKIDDLEVVDLTAIKADITTLNAKVANIDHVLAGNITAENIQTGAITAGSGIIAEGAIGDAQISSLSADKIRAGRIDTSLVTVASSDSVMSITGNQLLINDTTLATKPINRVTLGKYKVNENNWEYGLLVRSSDGQTVMIDGNGVHNAGITDGAVDNNKVASDANIDGTKLNINSVVTQINNGTTKITSTVVQVGTKSLEVYLSEQTETIEGQTETLAAHSSKISANEKAISLKVDSQTYVADKADMTSKLNKTTSDLSVVQGQISSKVWETDITTAVDAVKNTEIKSLTDRYTTLNQTVEGIRGTVASHTTQIASKADGSTVTKLQSTVTNLSADLDGFKTSVEDTYTTKSEFNKLDIGGRNLLTNCGQYTEDSPLILKSAKTDGVNEALNITTSIKLKAGTYILQAKTDGTWVSKHNSSGFDPLEKRIALWLFRRTSTGGSTGHIFVNMINNPTKVSIVTEGTYYLRTNLYSDGVNEATVKLWNIQLEEGNKPTDWMPAPEDVNSFIGDVSEQVTNLGSSLDVVKGQISGKVWQTDITTAVDSVKKNEIKTISDKYAQLELNINEFKTTVSGTYTTKKEFDDLEIGGRNIALLAGIDSGGTSSFDKSEYVKSGTVTFGRTATGNGGIILDRAAIYEPSTKYVLRFKAKLNSGSIGNFYFYNGQGMKNTSVYADGKHLGAYNTYLNCTFTTGKYIEIVTYFETPATLLDFTEGVQRTYWQPEKGGAKAYNVTITELKIEKGTKFSDWSPPPEDVNTNIETVSTTATQLSNKFDWVVKSGTSSSNFQITDRMATLTASYINLNGLVKFSGLASDAQSKVNTAYNTANSVNSTVNSNKANWDKGLTAYNWTNANGTKATNLYNMVTKWTNGAVSGTTEINGGWIKTDTITADKLAVNNLAAISGTLGTVKLGGSSTNTYGQLQVYGSTNKLEGIINYNGFDQYREGKYIGRLGTNLYADGTTLLSADYDATNCKGFEVTAKNKANVLKATLDGTYLTYTNGSASFMSTGVYFNYPNGYAKFSDSYFEIKSNIADNDWAYIGTRNWGTDKGYLLFATGDGKDEPILFRQYSGEFSGSSTTFRQVELMDSSGATVLPVSLSLPNMFISSGSIEAKSGRGTDIKLQSDWGLRFESSNWNSRMITWTNGPNGHTIQMGSDNGGMRRWFVRNATSNQICMSWDNDDNQLNVYPQIEAQGGVLNGSTEKLKTNIEKANVNALDIISQSELYTYNLKSLYNQGITKPQFGFIIERECPDEIVSHNRQAVDTYSIAAIAWKGIKELHEEIKSLKKIIADQQETIGNLLENKNVVI